MSDEKTPTGQGEGIDQGSATSLQPKATCPVGQGPTLDRLSPEHLTELRASAISDAVIDACGAYTAYERDDLPEPLRWVGDRDGALPALVIPMTEAGRGMTWQVKPRTGTVAVDGRTLKYICPSKSSGAIVPSLIERRAVTDETKRVLIVEGTKQSMAVLSCTDSTTAVYGVPGIQSWMGGEDGPSPAFSLVTGLSTYILPDADAARNRAVYDGASALGAHCRQWGASPVRYISIPGHGTQGVDDVLASVDAERRAELLDLWVRQAGDKPSLKMPPKKKKPEGEDLDDDRPRVSADAPPQEILSVVGGALHTSLGGRSLFRQGSSLVSLVEMEGRRTLAPVSRALMQDLGSQAAAVVHETERASRERFLSGSEADMLLSPPRVAPYPRIDGIFASPVVSGGGRIVSDPGYDAGSGVYLDLSRELVGFSVPESPSPDDVTAALNLLEEMLVDFPFKTAADRTRALGMLLTTVTRLMYGTSPMIVVTANTRGSGKNLLADNMSLIATGECVSVQRLPDSETEVQKVLVSALLAGRTQLTWDEASAGLDSPTLSAFLTSEVFGGRRLGESEDLRSKNLACVWAMGNNVSVSGDLSRRTIAVELESPLSDPEARTGFKHADLRGWVRSRRRELLEAVFTLVQSWVVAGRPAPTSSAPVGSFEGWFHVVGGVLEHAGLPDLMEGVAERRAAGNVSEQEDLAFLAWVVEVTGGSEFIAFDLEEAVATYSGYVPLPSTIQSLGDATARRLGRALTRMQDRHLGGYVVRSAGTQAHVKKYRVDVTGGPGNGGDGTPPPSAPTPGPGDPSAPIGTLVFDLETGSADDLHTASDPGWVRLAAYSIDGADPVATTDIRELVGLIERAETVVGHNIVAYDLPALARHYGLDVDALVAQGRVRDTLVLARLAEPPRPGLRYGLDAVATRQGVDGKILSAGESALKKLARDHGGYDRIPVDDEDYRAYATQDVRATAAVYAALLPRAVDVVGEEYVTYEHQVAHALAQVESHGVRVDRVEVERRLADEDLVRGEIRTWLVETVGIPDEGKAPWASAEGKAALARYVHHAGAELPLTAKGSVSASGEAFAAVAAEHPESAALAELAEKMTTLLQASSPAATVKKCLRSDDRVYPAIQPSQATGRLSTTSPGMTIFGSRSDRLIAQRAMIVPDEGDVMVAVDLSGIDARCMAAGSGDAAYAALFQPGVDLHSETAARLFGDPGRRADAKIVNHSMNYGVGAAKLSAALGVSEGEARQILTDYDRAYPGLAAFKARLRAGAESGGYVTSGYGRRVAVPRDRAWTQAPAGYGQATARDAFLTGVLSLPDEVSAMVRIFVHDEVVLSVPGDRAEEIQAAVVATFESVTLPCAGGVVVPVLAEAAGPAETWAGCK
ncbi:DNA polymerase [Corynebacterium doosanense]|uniref:DNA-directed DNA polymerase n=1 Tax=Corynebacterium doosanense CAU 212 = DSM 45436 TaxID=558173 RepID=A0A097IEC5_9CORY|nr:DNA polymerase [Corynebacterium doosanense]AIT60482.1 DNA polymerase I [Corynebacterium doosanense CAU 212 = DSM 45436]